jgi:hypothetical protein
VIVVHSFVVAWLMIAMQYFAMG